MDVKFDKTGSIETRTIEECSELIHVLCKAERFGWTNYHPEDEYQVPNYQLAINEINDLDRRLLELKIKLMEFGPSTPISQPQENLADSSQAVQQTHEAISLLEYIDELLRSIGQINEGSPVHKRINAVLAKQHHA